MKTVVTISGIRPDFIRMSEVFKQLDKRLNHILIHTGQHYDNLLSDVFFKDLDIREPDYNLGIGGPGKKHYEQQADLGVKIINLFEEKNISPDAVLFLGDSNSVLASVPLRKEGYFIGHIEAGMRSYDERMLEEINRKVCDHVSNVLFVYHDNYKQKAVKEGISEDKIYVVGNTIVEPLKKIAAQCHSISPKHVLLDIHRPENFKDKYRMKAILDMAKFLSGSKYPVKMLKFGRTMKALDSFGLSTDGVEMVPLMGYKDFIEFQLASKFMISDSGTAQEEPALLDIPVIVPRDYTERPESLEAGNSMMFYLDDFESSMLAASQYLTKYSSTEKDISWLGDGTTSQKIVDILEDIL